MNPNPTIKAYNTCKLKDLKLSRDTLEFFQDQNLFVNIVIFKEHIIDFVQMAKDGDLDDEPKLKTEIITLAKVMADKKINIIFR